MTNPTGLFFRLDPVSGKLVPIPDSSVTNSPGDQTLVVTGVPGGVAPDAVASLAYANGAVPLPWWPAARWTVSYSALLNPPAANVARFTAY